MLFMVMHKVTESMEAGGKPDPKLIAEMGKLIGETVALGSFTTARACCSRPSSSSRALAAPGCAPAAASTLGSTVRSPNRKS